jgi:hypothetical protein
MDRHRIELQIRAVLVSYRAEAARRDGASLAAVRRRAGEIFALVDAQVRDDPELRTALDDARREIGILDEDEPATG